MLAEIESKPIRLTSSPCVASLSTIDEEVWSDMAWTKPRFTRADVDRAGDFLVNETSIASSYALQNDVLGYVDAADNAYAVINNWRSAHSYPLQVLKMTLRKRAKKVDSQAIVAQRIKRLSSIESKLIRNPTMQLSQMQDLGGCRAVLGTVGRLLEVAKMYEKFAGDKKRDCPEYVKKYDYIQSPKVDGYRSVHFVFKYHTKATSRAAFDGLRIEIQLRSRWQHAWATAVETVSTFTGQALKSNIGDDLWKRFFALMGTSIANREGSPCIPNTPEDRALLRDELRHYAEKLDVQHQLQMYGIALRNVPENVVLAKAQYFLLELDVTGKQLIVRGYGDKQLEEATAEYLKVEKSEKASNTVLVSVDSMTNLRRAFPNYFADTMVFLNAVNKALS